MNQEDLSTMLNEKIIDVIEIHEVEFTFIEKAKTFYAGSYFVANDPNDIRHAEPDWEASGKWFESNKHRITGSITPECVIGFSIDYTRDERPCAVLHGQETNSPNQPEDFHVMESEPAILIKVKSTDAAWDLTKKLTGYDSLVGLSPLFFLIWQLFCGGESKYERTSDIVKGHHEAIYDYSNGDKYVTVPVKLKNAIPEQWDN
jgi:hypothetical protein